MEPEKILALLKDMSLEEKIDQLFQSHGGLYEGDSVATGPAAEQGFPEHAVMHAGSVLSAIGAESTRRIQKNHMERQPHHIPLMFMADIINGYKTIFPIPLAQGAAFNPEVAKEGAGVAAKEASAAGIHITFSPMVDLVRDARWGRVMESNGEDPYLNSLYAKALVEGYQGEDVKAPGQIGACVKHFAAYGAPVAGRDYNNVELSERTLREDYLPAYEAAVKAGAVLVMTSFNTLNRVPSSVNSWLLRDVLRGEMGFDGVIISDWAAIEECIRHGVAVDKKDVAAKALTAGTEIDMMTNCYCSYLKDAIEEGMVSKELLDEAVLRVLELKNKLGLFENPYKDADVELEKKVVLCKEHRKKARKAAAETFVLLENDGMLPLKKEEKVAFIGPYAEEKNIIGFWSIFGDEEDAVSIREGVERKDVKDIRFSKGCEILSDGDCIPGLGTMHRARWTVEERGKYLAEAIEAAKEAKKVVLCLGEHIAQSGEAGSRAEIGLPEVQMDLLKEVSKVNSNISVVLFTGRPLDLRKVKELSKAILVVWMPGTEGGNAIADVLYGDATPGGRLPMSFPYCVGQVPVFYGEFSTGREIDTNNEENRYQSRYLDIPNAPLYPFGYGLSYTTFAYGDVAVEEKENQVFVVQSSIKNTGSVADYGVVQLYVRDDKASVARPVRELKGFQKVWLEAGEEKKISFTLTEEELKFYDLNMNYVAEPGSFTVYVGGDSTTDNHGTFCLTL